MVAYVEHLRRVNAKEASDHQATRLRLMKAQQEWNIGDMADNSVNVNITRRSSTIVGGQTQVIEIMSFDKIPGLYIVNNDNIICIEHRVRR